MTTVVLSVAAAGETESEAKAAMEMEMRATEAIEMGEDITPPLSPITSALHDSFLLSHCSSCFSPLPPLLLSHGDSLHYCSTPCFSFHASTPRFFSSHHLPFSDTADLRAASRLLSLARSNPSARQSGPPERIFGILTNREKLMCSSREIDGDEDDPSVRIRNGAEAMAGSDGVCGENELEEAILCLVLTNAVEVLDGDGRTLGIAVYGPRFCWINHSCSPNACYRFLQSLETETEWRSNETVLLRMEPCCSGAEAVEGGDQMNSTSRINQTIFITKDLQDYGPRIIVRSIKNIKEGEAITITYCDLLQPKAMRQSELWSRYQFVCCCQRCSTKRLTYVDHALQEISAAKLDSFDSTPVSNFRHDDALRRINDYVDNAITEYLSIGTPESCCENLENMLTSGFYDEQVDDSERKQPLNLKLNPLHHLSLNAYTALASAYKVRSSDLLASYSKEDEHPCDDAFAMIRTSAAYSLLLAGATHHLFLSDLSLIASAANSWVFAGESLINLSRSSLWANFSKQSYYEKRDCSKCSWISKLKTSRIHGKASSFELHEFSTEFYDCVANISQKTWSFLSHGCHYLKAFGDPFDCRWNESSKILESNDKAEDIVCKCESQERLVIFELGFHCLLYGGYLASICYGQHSHLGYLIQNILDEMN